MKNNFYRIQELDFLRTIGIFSVMLCHLNMILPLKIDVFYFGRFGVQLFFVCSGIIIIESINKKKYSIKEFIYKRFLRLFPSYLLAIFIFYLLAEEKYDSYLIVLDSLLLNSFNFLNPYGIVPGGWSISVEWIFYLVIILLLNSLNIFRLKQISLIIFIINALLFNFFKTKGTLSSLTEDFFYMNFANNFIFFIYGYSIFKHEVTKSVKNILLIVLMSLILFLLKIFHYESFMFILVWAFILFGCIFIFQKGSFIVQYFLKLYFIGRHSYGIYLSHFLILYYLKHYDDFEINLVIKIFLYFMLSIILGVYFDKFMMKFYNKFKFIGEKVVL